MLKCTGRAYVVPRLLRMCGICGVVSASGSVDPERVVRMSATLVHRGPDSAGEFGDGTAALAARRLSIIDLETGDQPIANEDGTLHVVQNGEIYNYRELRARARARGHRFRTHGDTEVIAAPLRGARATAFAERLRGMFAFAIWDATRRRLVLARDRFGIKPLYYRDADGELAFASELRALPRGEVDLDALEAFLAFNYVPAPLTIFRGVRKLPPGTCWSGEDGRVALERYCAARARAGATTRDEDEAELVEELRARLRDAVRAHLVSDVPVGVFLSGGVDSACSPRSRPRRARSRCDVLDRLRGALFDELADARLVAERYGTTHRELVAAAGRCAAAAGARRRVRRAVRRLVRAADVPRLAARGRATSRSRSRARAATSSSAATTPTQLTCSRSVSAGSRAARAAARRAAADLDRRASFDYRAKRFVRAAHLPPLERHHGWKEIFSADARAELTGPPLDRSTRSTCCARATPRPGRRLARSPAGRRPRHVYLVDDLLVKTDRASMAHSLEARVPFLDTGRDRISRSRCRRATRYAGSRRRCCCARRPSRCSRARSCTAEARLLDPRRRLAARRARAVRPRHAVRRSRAQGFFRPARSRRLLDDHVPGREDRSRQLWGLLCVHALDEQHVEREHPEPRSRNCSSSAEARPTLREMSPPLIAHIVGARPNYMKVAPIYAELGAPRHVDQRLIHTGQHYDATDQGRLLRRAAAADAAFPARTAPARRRAAAR